MAVWHVLAFLIVLAEKELFGIFFKKTVCFELKLLDFFSPFYIY